MSLSLFCERCRAKVFAAIARVDPGLVRPAAEPAPQTTCLERAFVPIDESRRASLGVELRPLEVKLSALRVTSTAHIQMGGGCFGLAVGIVSIDHCS